MKMNDENKTKKVPEQSGEGVGIIQGVIHFLSLFRRVPKGRQNSEQAMRMAKEAQNAPVGIMNTKKRNFLVV